MSISLITHQDDKGGLLYNYITYLWRKILKVVSFTLMDVSTLTIKNNKKLSIFVLLLLGTHIWCTELQSRGRIYHSSRENLAHKSAECLRAAGFRTILECPGLIRVSSRVPARPHGCTRGICLVGPARRLAPVGGQGRPVRPRPSAKNHSAQMPCDEAEKPLLYCILLYFFPCFLWETSAFPWFSLSCNFWSVPTPMRNWTAFTLWTFYWVGSLLIS